MANTIYASFADTEHAERAAGALLDHEMDPADLSIVRGDVNEDHWSSYHEGQESEEHVEGGITTTTGADAASGAAKGLGWGAVIGVLAGLGMLWIPGIGLVLGGGALATALAAAAGTAGAGAMVGGVTGYLKDQGIEPDKIKTFEDHLESGGAVLELHLPSGEVDLETAQMLLSKYDANQSVVEGHGMR